MMRKKVYLHARNLTLIVMKKSSSFHHRLLVMKSILLIRSFLFSTLPTKKEDFLKTAFKLLEM